MQLLHSVVVLTHIVESDRSDANDSSPRRKGAGNPVVKRDRDRLVFSPPTRQFLVPYVIRANGRLTEGPRAWQEQLPRSDSAYPARYAALTGTMP